MEPAPWPGRPTDLMTGAGGAKGGVHARNDRSAKLLSFLELHSGPAGTRTQDHRIKSPVLYQLSYRPLPRPHAGQRSRIVPRRPEGLQRWKITKSAAPLKLGYMTRACGTNTMYVT
jgi:hypothetical protein